MDDDLSIREIEIALIETGNATQMRVAGTDPAVVVDYADAMEAGTTFPPIVVFYDGEAYWPADGFHRIEAAKRIDVATIPAEVREGGQREAVLVAACANADHGLRRSQADKRRSVETLLRDPVWSRWSDREIGKACKVDHKTVGKVRRELTGEIPSDRTVTYRNRHGNETEMRVSAPSPSGTMREKILAGFSDEVLIAECCRRGLGVTNV